MDVTGRGDWLERGLRRREESLVPAQHLVGGNAIHTAREPRGAEIEEQEISLVVDAQAVGYFI